MGLDMYLVKKTYVKNWDHNPKKERHEVIVLKGDKVHPSIKPERISSIEEEVAYWRKANAIHKWFVENVQNNEDDCKEYYVETEQLKELVNECNKVLKNNKVAEEVLPTASGFFFGNTDYNEYYLGNLQETVDQLSIVIKEQEENKHSSSFYYSSSW